MGGKLRSAMAAAMLPALLLLSSCGPFNTQNVQITAPGPNGPVVFSDNPQLGPHTYNAGGLGPVPSISLADGFPAGQTPVIHYSNSQPNFASQSELVMFARDADEAYASFRTTNTTLQDLNPATWDANVFTRYGDTARPVALPDVFVLPYPIGPGVAPDTPTAQAIYPNFFVGSGSFVGPAASPSGKGSVKSLFVYQRGTCSRETDIQSILANIDLQTVSGIRGSPPFTAVPQWVHSVSYVVQDSSTASAPIGGFVLGAYATAAAGLSGLGVTNFSFQFGLPTSNWPFAGILGVTPSQNALIAQGDLPVGDKIAKAMREDVPTGILHAALAQQGGAIPAGAIPPDVDCNGSQPMRDARCFLACNPDFAVPSDDQLGRDPGIAFQRAACPTAAVVLGPAIATGANHLGLDQDLTASIQQNLEQIFQPNGVDTWVNVRCNFHPSYVIGSKPVCEVVARAHRVNVFPDAVELVWFDRTDGLALTDAWLRSQAAPLVTNEAFALFVALNQTITGPTPDFSALCQRQPATTIRSRQYAHDAINYPIATSPAPAR